MNVKEVSPAGDVLVGTSAEAEMVVPVIEGAVVALTVSTVAVDSAVWVAAGGMQLTRDEITMIKTRIGIARRMLFVF
jgi:hypothetical protein